VYGHHVCRHVCVSVKAAVAAAHDLSSSRLARVGREIDL